MRKFLAPAMFALALIGCSGATSSSFRGAVAVLEEPGDHNPGPCFERRTEEGPDGPQTIWQHVGYENCVEFDEPRTFRGAWLREFEGSLFHEGRDRIPDGWAAYRDDAWLETSETSQAAFAAQFPECLPSRRCAFLIEFVGRKSKLAGRYGHMGGSDHLIIVDRIVSIQRVTPPPIPDPRTCCL